jgi:hypothetical protein
MPRASGAGAGAGHSQPAQAGFASLGAGALLMAALEHTSAAMRNTIRRKVRTFITSLPRSSPKPSLILAGLKS